MVLRDVSTLAACGRVNHEIEVHAVALALMVMVRDDPLLLFHVGLPPIFDRVIAPVGVQQLCDQRPAKAVLCHQPFYQIAFFLADRRLV